MPQTATPTPAESYAVLRNIPRPGDNQKRIVELLDANINAHIANASANLVAAGEPALKPLSGVAAVPYTMGDEFINHALVGLDTTFKAQGGGLIDAQSILSIYIVDERLSSGETPHPHWDRALVIVAFLEKFLPGYYDGNNDQKWRHLVPVAMTKMPDDYKDYSGVMLTYDLKQLTTARVGDGAASNYWPAQV